MIKRFGYSMPANEVCIDYAYPKYKYQIPIPTWKNTAFPLVKDKKSANQSGLHFVV